MPPTRWSWENSDWASRAEIAGDAWTSGELAALAMVSEAKLEEIRRSMMDIHRLALSHIVAADHATMIRLVQEIKAEEGVLDTSG